MRMLVDSNLILDFLQEREQFVEDAGEIKGFIAATKITNIYYIVPRAVGLAAAVSIMNLRKS
jgi:hypothetical protein